MTKLEHAMQMEAEAQERANQAPAGGDRGMHNAEAIRWLGVQLVEQRLAREEATHGSR